MLKLKPAGLLVFFILLLFISANILASQIISPVYLGVVNENQGSVISYLKKIRNLPLFVPEYRKFEVILGPQIWSGVFSKEIQRNGLINKLQSKLTLNSQSRDILYSLSLLYNAAGNTARSEKYLKLAKEVDPDIK